MSTIGVTFDSHGCKLLGRMWLGKAEGPKPTVLLLHGLPGIDQNHDLAFALKNIGWNSLVFHYRGSWGSDGTYSLHNVLPDIDNALDFLKNHSEVDAENIVVCGHSLGGWAAVMTGARHPEVKGVISLAGVADWSEMGLPAEYAAENMAPYLNGITGAKIVKEKSHLEQATDHVTKLNGRPLLVVQGDQDAAVHMSQSQRLKDLYPEHTMLQIIEGADHGYSWEREEMIGTVLKWVARF